MNNKIYLILKIIASLVLCALVFASAFECICVSYELRSHIEGDLDFKSEVINCDSYNNCFILVLIIGVLQLVFLYKDKLKIAVLMSGLIFLATVINYIKVCVEYYINQGGLAIFYIELTVWGYIAFAFVVLNFFIQLSIVFLRKML